MKLLTRLWPLALLPLLASCAFQPITLGPVGPGPGPSYLSSPSLGKGQLQVYTETEETEMDKDVPYFPHADYELYTIAGKHLQRVWNHQDREDETPTVVTLPAGQYLVQADAALYGPVSVPVVIQPNQLTRVILQPGWKPGKEVARSELVNMPNGYPVGWRAELPTTK